MKTKKEKLRQLFDWFRKEDSEKEPIDSFIESEELGQLVTVLDDGTVKLSNGYIYDKIECPLENVNRWVLRETC